MKPELTEIETLKKTHLNYLPERYRMQKGATFIVPVFERKPNMDHIEAYRVFIDLYQKKHRAPAKFIHSLTISIELFIECCKIGIIDNKHLCSEGIAYFAFGEETVTISFDRFYIANDIHIRILEHVVFRKTGEIPVKRNAKSKMNEESIDINKFAEKAIKGK